MDLYASYANFINARNVKHNIRNPYAQRYYNAFTIYQALTPTFLPLASIPIPEHGWCQNTHSHKPSRRVAGYYMAIEIVNTESISLTPDYSTAPLWGLCDSPDGQRP
jgi:hypothetical protein